MATLCVLLHRRGSMADYAFPELHSSRRASRASSHRNSAQEEPDNLLILTRTRTDRHGRRHSVAVPLVPPPEGEKFEGGYHVERNPITGGARLVPPSPTGEDRGGWGVGVGGRCGRQCVLVSVPVHIAGVPNLYFGLRTTFYVVLAIHHLAYHLAQKKIAG